MFKENSQLLVRLGYGDLTEETLNSVKKSACKIYEPVAEITNIDQLMVFLYNKGKDPDSLPPTSDVLKLHISQAHYQTSVWLNATVPSPEGMDPETCGWERDPYSNHFKSKLSVLEPIPKVCTELLQCGCKPVPQGDINADQTKSHAFRRAAVDPHVAIHKTLDSEDET